MSKYRIDNRQWTIAEMMLSVRDARAHEKDAPVRTVVDRP